MKNVEAIKQKMKDIEADDFLGFTRGDLIDALPFDDAKEYLKEGVTKKQWENHSGRLKTDSNVIAAMRDYLKFAYEKAEGQRGISANRSINHYQAWSFLIDDKLHKWINEAYATNYNSYGIPILDHIKKWLSTQA